MLVRAMMSGTEMSVILLRGGGGTAAHHLHVRWIKSFIRTKTLVFREQGVQMDAGSLSLDWHSLYFWLLARRRGVNRFQSYGTV